MRRALRDYVNGLGWGGQTRVAAELGISQQHISRMIRKDAPEDPGIMVARRLAKVLHVSETSLLAGNPQPAEARIEREDRYPERAKAIKAAEALGIRPDAISNVAGTHWKSAESRDARWWLAQIQGESDRLDAFDDNPALREQEREQSARDTAELVRQEQEMLRERNEKYFGKKAKK